MVFFCFLNRLKDVQLRWKCFHFFLLPSQSMNIEYRFPLKYTLNFISLGDVIKIQRWCSADLSTCLISFQDMITSDKRISTHMKWKRIYWKIQMISCRLDKARQLRNKVKILSLSGLIMSSYCISHGIWEDPLLWEPQWNSVTNQDMMPRIEIMLECCIPS